MKELRCIVFNDQEVVTAFINRRRRLREALPVGTIQGVQYEVSAGDGVTTTIRLVDDYGAVETVTVRAAEIAAALVDFCLNRHIPIPAGSRKWIEAINPGEVTLMMTLDGTRKKKAPPPRRVPVPA